MRWNSQDTEVIRETFSCFIYGGDEQPLKQEKLKTFIAENNIETLNGRTLNNKVALLRVKINNEKEIAEENAIRALKNISKTK